MRRHGTPAPSQRGFTLMEMMVALTVASIIMASVAQLMLPSLKFYGRQETAARLQDLQLAMEQAFAEQSAQILTAFRASGADQDARTIPLRDGELVEAMPATDSVYCTATVDTFAPLARDLVDAAVTNGQDGYGNALCLAVTGAMVVRDPVTGLSFPERVVAVISPGGDGGLDPGTAFDYSSGVLTLAGDDRGFALRTGSAMREQLATAHGQLRKWAGVLSDYFRLRYLSNPERDVSVNYFASRNPDGDSSPRYDATGILPTTGGVYLDIADAWIDSLGLSTADAQDPWGGRLALDNSSEAVRHPDNPNVAMKAPPYSLRLRASVGQSGLVLETSAVGRY